MHFSSAKSKELLAYLVDRQGALVTRVEAFAALYEDENYTRNNQKKFDEWAMFTEGLLSQEKY